jgi:HSP20 family protein
MTKLLFNQYRSIENPLESILDDLIYSNDSKTNVIDHSDKIEIVAQVPGCTKDDISIDLKNDVLHIKSSDSIIKKSKEIKYLVHQFSPSKYDRKFKINEKMNSSKIKAFVENGLLRVEIMKKEPEKPKRIKIL